MRRAILHQIDGARVGTLDIPESYSAHYPPPYLMLRIPEPGTDGRIAYFALRGRDEMDITRLALNTSLFYDEIPVRQALNWNVETQ